MGRIYQFVFIFTRYSFSIPYEYALCVAKASCLAQLKSSPRVSLSSTLGYAVVTCQLVCFFSITHPPRNTHPVAKSTIYYQIWSLDRQTQ